MRDSYYIILKGYFHKDKQSGKWIAICEELGTAIQANTIEDANEIILEAVKLHLQGLIEEGIFKRFISENHIKVHKTPTPKERIEIHRFSVPYKKNTFFQPLIGRVPHFAEC